MISVASWKGALLADVLEKARAKPDAKRVLISGFDTYAAKSTSSIPGASWVFTADELRKAGAFLATEMNGSPLTSDHGAPVRLVVPGWYGCTCIKWVNEIAPVDEAAEATAQMARICRPNAAIRRAAARQRISARGHRPGGDAGSRREMV